MADIVQDGDQGSRAVFMAALTALQAQGQSVLDSLAQTRLDTLCRFEQDLRQPARSTSSSFRGWI